MSTPPKMATVQKIPGAYGVRIPYSMHELLQYHTARMDTSIASIAQSAYVFMHYAIPVSLSLTDKGNQWLRKHLRTFQFNRLASTQDIFLKDHCGQKCTIQLCTVS